MVKSWSCTGIAIIQFLLMETRMLKAPEGGRNHRARWRKPRGNGANGRTYSSAAPEWQPHQFGRCMSPGAEQGPASGVAPSGLGSFSATSILGAHAPSSTMSPLRGCGDRAVA